MPLPRATKEVVVTRRSRPVAKLLPVEDPDSRLRAAGLLEPCRPGPVPRVRPVRLARSGIARGADPAIAAQMLLVAGASAGQIEFVTADAAQARMVRREAARRELNVDVVELPA